MTMFSNKKNTQDLWFDKSCLFLYGCEYNKQSKRFNLDAKILEFLGYFLGPRG